MSPLRFPKPRKKKPRPRRFGSSLPVGEKTRSKPRKPLAKRNAARQAKASKRSAVKHRAYMASATRAMVDARADGRCELLIIHRATERGQYPFSRIAGAVPPWTKVPLRIADRLSRCTETEALEHHHLTYARYGGDELPSDVVKVCKAHHDYLESLKPAGNRRSRQSHVAVHPERK